MRRPFAEIARIGPDLAAALARAMVAGATLLAAASSLAAEPDRMKACFSDWPPYAYLRDDAPAGLSVRVIGEAARRSRLQATFTPLPWARCLSAVELGDFDVALDGLPRAPLLNGETPHLVVVAAILVRGDIGKPIDGPGSLNGLTFGHPIGWAIIPPLQAMLDSRSITLVRPATREQVVAMMKLGRADFAYDAYAEFQRIAREAGLAVVSVPGTVAATRMYPLVSPGRPMLLERLDAALAGMAADGTLDRLFVEEVGISRSDLLAAGQAATN